MDLTVVHSQWLKDIPGDEVAQGHARDATDDFTEQHVTGIAVYECSAPGAKFNLLCRATVSKASAALSRSPQRQPCSWYRRKWFRSPPVW